MCFSYDVIWHVINFLKDLPRTPSGSKAFVLHGHRYAFRFLLSHEEILTTYDAKVNLFVLILNNFSFVDKLRIVIVILIY